MRPTFGKLFALVLGLLLTLGGCVPVDFIDPPSLSMDLGPPPPPRINQVDITNGAGKPVMSGQPDGLGDLNANPDLSDLDGTLTVVSTWSDGRKVSQTITHTANTRIKLIYDRASQKFSATEQTAPPKDAATSDAGGGD